MSGRRWSWLGEPLAHDFANTIHWRGTTPVDHIVDAAGLRSWLDHEPHELPHVPDVTPALTTQVRHLRDAVRAAMTAVAAGGDPAASDIDLINDTARRHPMTRTLGPHGAATALKPARQGTQPLLGALAQAAVGVLGEPEPRQRIAFCSAPGCGGLFDRHRPNQVWCDPHCGARARAERHQRAGARPPRQY